MKLFISILCMALIPTFVGAQELAPIKLPAPDMKRSCTLMKALSDRHSDRTFSGKELSLQDLSDLLWAANGINRKEKGMRTAPSALNKQDIDIYAVMKKGAYRYDAGKHELTPLPKATSGNKWQADKISSWKLLSRWFLFPTLPNSAMPVNAPG